jgi:dUTP pyrophosphatase
VNTTFKFEKLRDVQTPSRSYDAAAGWDFYIPDNFRFIKPHFMAKFQAHTNWESKVVPSRRALFIPSGIRIEMQEGWAMKFENKSGIAIRGLLVGATIIDQDYQGEVHLHLWNVSQDDIVVKAGQKIVQGIFFQTYDVELKEETDGLFTRTSSRGGNGFGSSQKINK